MALIRALASSGGSSTLQYGSQIPLTLNQEYQLPIKNGMIYWTSDVNGSSSAGTFCVVVIDGQVVFQRTMAYTTVSYNTTTNVLTYKMTNNYPNNGAAWVVLD